MKASFLNQLVPIACSVTALLFTPPNFALAQTTPPPSAFPGGAGYVMEIKDHTLLPGGKRKASQPATLQNLVDVLREENPEVNIVVTPNIAEVTIGFLKLRAASLEDELEALSVASGGLFVWEKRKPNGPEPRTAVDPATGLPLPAGYSVPGMSPLGTTPHDRVPTLGDPASSLYILREPAVPVESRRKVEAFNLSGYLKNTEKSIPDSLKEIERIVGDTFEEMKGSQAAQNRPTFKFHAGANLLIVVGPQEAIEIARQVVNALPGQEPHHLPGYGGFPGEAVTPPRGGPGGLRYPGAAGDPFQPARR